MVLHFDYEAHGINEYTEEELAVMYSESAAQADDEKNLLQEESEQAEPEANSADDPNNA